MDGPYDAPVSKVGQISIPMPVRKALGLDTDRRVHFLIPDFLEGAALMVPETVMHEWLRTGLDAAMAARLPRSDH